MKRRSKFIFLGLLGLALILLGWGACRLRTAYKPEPIDWIHGFERSYLSLDEGEFTLPEEIRFRMKVHGLDRDNLRLRGTVRVRLESGQEETREGESLILYEVPSDPQLIFGAMMSFNSVAHDFEYWGISFTPDMTRLAIRLNGASSAPHAGEIRYYASEPGVTLAEVQEVFAPYLPEEAGLS